MEKPFELKSWLDENVIPLLGSEPTLELHSVLQNRPPGAVAPLAIAVWTMAPTPHGWAPAVRRVLEQPGFYFDFLRAPQRVAGQDQATITMFGGDGAPFFNQAGAAMARLYRRCGDIDLIIEIAHRFPSIEAAASAVKSFFGQFPGTNPFDVITNHRPPFGLS